MEVEQVVFEVVRCKITRSASLSLSHKIEADLEASYSENHENHQPQNKKVFRSPRTKFFQGVRRGEYITRTKCFQDISLLMIPLFPVYPIFKCQVKSLYGS
jgi:hypothetical protein